jgi:transposase
LRLLQNGASDRVKPVVAGELGMALGFRGVDRDTPMLLPPDLRDWLPSDHLAWLVLEVVDQLDLSGLEARYRLGSAGREAYDPAMMTALLIYAYCCGVRSSRVIERSCRTDVAFRVIAAQQHPDHVTIARFRQALEQGLADLFGQVLEICAKAGLGRVGVVGIDGSKMAANASSRKNHREDRLRQMAADMLAEAEAVDAAEDAEYGPDRRGDELPEPLAPGAGRKDRIRAALDSIEEEKAQRVADDAAAAERKRDRAEASMRTAVARAERIHQDRSTTRAGRREVSEHKPVQEAAAALELAEDQLAQARAGQGRRASGPPPRRNITDPDSRLMRTGGKGFLQGFNAQLVVSEDHLVIATDVTNCRNDMTSFVPMLNLATHNLDRYLPSTTIGMVLADAGYCSTEALTSPGPDRLIATGRDPAKPGKSEPIRQMANRLKPDRPDRQIYNRRQTIVEPVIGHLKDRIGLRRFSRRGIQAARHELALAGLAHNIRRLAVA